MHDPRSAEVTPGGGAAPPRRVLLVEDDLDVRDVLVDVLLRRRYQVLTAGDGAEALELLRAPELPQVILLDLMMPRMDGREFLRRRDEEGLALEVPVAVFTAIGVAPRDLPPADAFLPKPTPLSLLIETIERLSRREQLRGAPGGYPPASSASIASSPSRNDG